MEEKSFKYIIFYLRLSHFFMIIFHIFLKKCNEYRRRRIQYPIFFSLRGGKEKINTQHKYDLVSVIQSTQCTIIVELIETSKRYSRIQIAIALTLNSPLLLFFLHFSSLAWNATGSRAENIDIP